MDTSFLNYWTNAVNDTSVLIVMALLDTILGVSWRIMKGKPILSNLFLSGLIKNLGCAFLPAILGLVSLHQRDHALLDVAIPIIAFGIFLGILQSIVANAVLCGIKIPSWAQKFYDRFFLDEQERKENNSNK